MASKPSAYLDWVTTGDAAKVVNPPSAQKNSGWTYEEEPPFEYMNWLFYQTDQWIKWLDENQNLNLEGAETGASIRLINGGFWSWVLGTSTLAWSAAFNFAVPGIADANNAAASGSCTLNDGQVAYVNANIPFTTTGTVQNGNTLLSNIGYEQGIVNGMTVSGANIPAATTISSFDPVARTAVMSAPATGNGSAQAITFSSTGALSVQVATESSLALGPNTIIIARRVGDYVFLGVNSGQALLVDGESKRLLMGGLVELFEATAGENLTKLDAVYICPGSDGGRNSGQAYKCDPSTTNAAVRGTIAGVVIKTVSAAGTAVIAKAGIMGGWSSLTPGTRYYVDPGTPGGKTSTRPSTAGQYVSPIGLALSSTIMLLNDAMGSATESVSTDLAYPTNFVASETDLANAITACGSNGGGVICLSGSFTISSARLIPDGTTLIGRGGATILTLASSGKITLGTNCKMQDVVITTALTANDMVAMTGADSYMRGCKFTTPAANTGACINVSGTGNLISKCSFYGVLGETATAINYSDGAENNDEYCSFYP